MKLKKLLQERRLELANKNVFATSFITPIGKQKVEPQTVNQIQADKANYQTSLRNIFADYGIDKTVSDEQGYRLVRNRLLSSGQPTELFKEK